MTSSGGAPAFPEQKHSIWVARFSHVDVDPVESTLVMLAGPSQPDGSVVDMPLVGPGLTGPDVRLAQIRFVPRAGLVRRAQVFEPLAPGAPAMVYTEVNDSSGQ